MSLSILHLSDLHLGKSALKDEDLKEQVPGAGAGAALDRLDGYLRSLDPRPDFVVISGDLTIGGGRDGLAQFNRWLDESTKVGILPSDTHILVVPGNHDVTQRVEKADGWHKIRYAAFDEYIAKAVPHAWLPDCDPPLNAKSVRLTPGPDGIAGGLRTATKFGRVEIVESAPFLLDHEHDLLLFGFNSTLACGVYRERDPKIVSLLEGLLATHGKGDAIDALYQISEGYKQSHFIDGGLIGKEQLSYFQSVMTRMRAELGEKFARLTKIAVLHHHVSQIWDQQLEVKSYETIIDAPLFKQRLVEFGFDFVLHGHKHANHVGLDSSISPLGKPSTHKPLCIVSGGTVGGYPRTNDSQTFKVLTFDEDRGPRRFAQIVEVPLLGRADTAAGLREDVRRWTIPLAEIGDPHSMPVSPIPYQHGGAVISHGAANPSEGWDACFPLSHPARLVYTCRGHLPPEFDCPAPLAPEARSLCLHVPVDEVETFALVLSHYAKPVLGERELEVASSLFCSRHANALLTYDPETAEPGVGAIGSELLGDLLVIGENQFSNRLLPFMGYPLPWRFHVSQVQPWSNFRLRLSCNPYRDFQPHDSYAKSQLAEQIRWGLLTYAPNPFAPDRWILSLVGCSRPGQYALLDWLRRTQWRQHAGRVPDSSWPPIGNKRFSQVVVWGQPADDQDTWNRILHNWCNLTEGRRSEGCGAAVFSAPEHPGSSGKHGDDMADVSLLAKVPKDESWLQTAIDSLPAELRSACSFGEPVGPHVTLFEFFNVAGTDSMLISEMQRAARHLIGDGSQFRAKLTELLHGLPNLEFVARQAQVTRHSIHVLGDLAMKPAQLKEALTWRPREALGPVDLVADACVEAWNDPRSERPRLPANRRFRIPYPLHLTLVRFPEDTNDRLRDLAREWVREHRSRVWGRSLKLELVLTAAFVVPFDDVRSVKVR